MDVFRSAMPEAVKVDWRICDPRQRTFSPLIDGLEWTVLALQMRLRNINGFVLGNDSGH
jgi:hypothetical protein